MSLFSDKINSSSVFSKQIKDFIIKQLSNESISVFDKIDINDIDTGELYESIFDKGEISEKKLSEIREEYKTNDTDKEISLKGILAELFNISSISGKIDEDGDGTIDLDEFESFFKEVSKLDGSENNISIDDLEKALNQLGIDLDNPDELEEENNNKAEKAKNNTTGNSNINSGSSYSPNVSRANNTNLSKASETTASEKDTATEIKNKISEKESEKEKLKNDADKEITEQQKQYDNAVKEAMENNDISEKVQEEYEEENAALEKKISDKDEEIGKQEDIIADKNAIIESKKESVISIENQISELESAKNESDSTDTSEIDTKIQTLKNEKDKLENEIKEAEESKKEAEDAKKKAEEEKTELEAQKQNLLTEFKKRYPQEAFDKVITETEQVKNDTQKNISEIKSNMDSNISTINNDIEKLKIDLAKAEEKEKTEKIINENSINTYNAEAGSKIANAALNVLGSTGLCLAGVSNSLTKAFGCGLSGLGSAYMAAEALRGNTAGYEEIAKHFKEVNVDRSELSSLPAGAIVVWDNNANGGGSNVSSLGKVHGHISIALGDGRESSDHIASQITDRDANFTVFYPV